MDTPKGKQLAKLFFFDSQRVGDRWKCDACGVFIIQRMSGFTNLCHHVRNKHESEVQSRVNLSRAHKPAVFHPLSFPSKTIAAHAWIEIVVLCLQPFNCVENNVLRRHFKHNAISLDSLTKYLRNLTEHVEKKIAALLPEKFAVVFDGWSGGDTHYVSIFATFPSEHTMGYDSVLLGCSPMGDEDSLDATEHYRFVEEVLKIFGKSWDNVAALVGDNCSTNRCFTRRVGPLFVGCYSHRYNLAMKDVISLSLPEVGHVRELMRKLSYQIPAARLRRLTHLKAKIDNDTRWSSTYEMLKRYIDIKDVLPELGMPEIDDLLLIEEDHIQVVSTCKKLEDIDSITKKLQDPTISISDTRALFDGMIERFSSMDCMKQRLGPKAAIVENPQFESAIVKIQDGFEHRLTPTEKRAVQHLLMPAKELGKRKSTGEKNLADELLKRHKTCKETQASRYMNTKFIVPTSNMCERLFSVAGWAMTNRRKSVSPARFEEQLFLNVNQSMWSISDVHAVVQKRNERCSDE